MGGLVSLLGTAWLLGNVRHMGEGAIAAWPILGFGAAAGATVMGVAAVWATSRRHPLPTTMLVITFLMGSASLVVGLWFGMARWIPFQVIAMYTVAGVVACAGAALASSARGPERNHVGRWALWGVGFTAMLASAAPPLSDWAFLLATSRIHSGLAGLGCTVMGVIVVSLGPSRRMVAATATIGATSFALALLGALLVPRIAVWGAVAGGAFATACSGAAMRRMRRDAGPVPSGP